MDNEKLRKDMMRLWKETFNDSDDYIRLVFDAYFDPEYVEFEIGSDGDVCASMLAIPYCFGVNNKQIKAVYLCGLATKREKRGCGIMTNLINRMGEHMKKLGYAFMFLIPADTGLQKFYSDRNFVAAFYRRADNYTASHDFTTEYFKSFRNESEQIREMKIRQYEALHVFCCQEGYFDDPDNAGTLSKLVDFIYKSENHASIEMPMIQSPKQIEIFLREALISDGSVYYLKNGDGNIEGVALTVPKEGKVTVLRLFVDGVPSRFKLLSAIKEYYENKSLVVYDDNMTEGDQAVRQLYYDGVDPEDSMAGEVDYVDCPYSASENEKIRGMLRILSVSEILKFVTNLSLNFKYSILTHQEKSGKICKYKAEDGKLQIEEVETGSPVLTDKEIAQLLFRKPSSDLLIEDALGLPAIRTSMFLMLD